MEALREAPLANQGRVAGNGHARPSKVQVVPSSAAYATEFGAVGDGVTSNTEILQAAIDRLAESGGGTLSFPPGVFLTGGLLLRDRVHLHLDFASKLLGSAKLEDYPLMDPPPVRFYEDAEGVRALLAAHGCNDIRLSGSGVINGQGNGFERYGDVRAGRPRLIWLADCSNVSVSGLRMRDSAFWVQHYLHCRNVRIEGIEVFSHASCNNDGLDIDGCRDVVVSNCVIDSHDDAICIKACNSQAAENIVITNCLTRTHCNHLKTGTESNGGFRNITVSNLQMVPSLSAKADKHTEGADYRGACGIALGSVDGGSLENISISHVQMDQVRVPFFVRLGDRGRPVNGSTLQQPPGTARGIRLSNIVAREASSQGCYAIGLPDSPVRALTISDSEFAFENEEAASSERRDVPLNRNAYPAWDAFGKLPSYGLYLRDAEDVRLTNVVFASGPSEARPALRWERVKRVVFSGVEDR